MKYLVKFDFKDEMTVEARSEDEAIEKFMEDYENNLAINNELIENRVWESLKAKKLNKKGEK